MKRFKGIFKRRRVSRDDMALIGFRATLATKVLELGTPNGKYAGMVMFPDITLDASSGYGCDAVGVSLYKPVDFCRSLVEGGYLATGIFVHLGIVGTRIKTWCNVDNVSDEDLIRIDRAVEDACMNRKQMEG